MILVFLAQRMRRLLRRWLAPGVCLALLWLLGAVLPAHAARLALVIGNDQYTNIERLKNARNDAKLISGVLKQAGFEVTLINDQSRIQLWSAIDSFRGRINKGDEVVFYFAGHGVQIGSNQLLLPTDIKARSELELQREGVSLVDVQDALKDARVAVLLIDACRDNPFPKQGTRSLGGTRGLSPPEPSTGQIIMMSAGRNQKALDSVPGQSIANGLFTWELAQLIQTPGLEIRQALEQVKDRVDDKAKQANHQQRPSVVSDLRGNFFFIAPGANVTIQVSPTPVSVPSATPVPTARPVSTDPETQFWYEVKANGTRGYFDAYIKQYPKGKYVALARVDLKNLDEQDKAAKAREEAERTNAAAEQLKSEQARSEQAAWNQAKATDSVVGYGSYLSAYPQGLYAALAELAKQRVQTQAAQREEAALWQGAQSGGKAQLQGYLSRYPGGQYASAANARLEQIKAEEARAASAAEEAAWAAAESGGTEAGYQSYLASYPQGLYAALVQPRMNNLKVQAAERERLAAEQRQREQTQAAQREEAALWQGAQSGDKAQLQGYLSRYPSGQYASAANARLEQIKAEEVKGPKPGPTFKDCSDCPEMVVLPAGSFTMGSSKGGDEGPAHSVTLARSFAMGKFEVTQGQWKALMGSNPSKFTQCGDDCPVETVSWDDAQAFIQKLSAKTGKNYRLPSEAEWEYACRAGGSHEYCGSDNLNAVGWNGNNSGGKTHPVGGKQANAWGLYDMSGNVWELVQDCLHDNYSGAPSDGSAWTRNCSAGNYRVLRGGSWYFDGSWYFNPVYLRSATRISYIPGFRNGVVGFRLARTAP